MTLCAVAVAARLRRVLRRVRGIAFRKKNACVVTLGEARHGCFSQCNGGAGVVQMHLRCSVTLGQVRHGAFSQCNGGADVVQLCLEKSAQILREKGSEVEICRGKCSEVEVLREKCSEIEISREKLRSRDF